MTVIWPNASKMCIIFGSRVVVGSPVSMVTPYRQETLFLVANQLAIHSCYNGFFIGRWGVVKIRAYDISRCAESNKRSVENQ